MPLKITIIVPPLRKKVSFYPPFGALSIIAAAEQDGHKAYLLDLDANRCSFENAVKQIVDLAPDVIGVSAVVATSYKYVKDLSNLIRQKLPKAVIVVGGGLTAAGDVILDNTAVDVLVHGEGEITFKELLSKIETGQNFGDVKGISFKQGNRIIKTAPREMISNLDILPFPDYDRLDLSKYILNFNDFIKGYSDADRIDKRIYDSGRSPHFIRINVSRGCVNRCTFCYRNMPGIRVHSLDYIANLIEHVKTKYNAGHISFGDECFGLSKKWLWDFIAMLRSRKFNLTYHITGMRVNTVDFDILKALKELGVWHIQFGFESGSQKILNVMEKGTTVEQNIEAVRMVNELGISTIPFIILGYPGETAETVHETLNFLKKANLMSKSFRPTFPMAIPGTALFEYAKLKGYITNEDVYLENISDVEAESLSEKNYFINYTDSSMSVVMGWMTLLQNENIKYADKRPGAVLLYKTYAMIKTRGFLKTIVFILQRFYTRVKAAYLEQVILKKDKTTIVAGSLGAASDFIAEISPEGESLRKVIQRLRASQQESQQVTG